MTSLRQKLAQTGKDKTSFPVIAKESDVSKESIKAWIKYIIYPTERVQKESLQFYVLKCDDPYNNRNITCVGHLLSAQIGDYLDFKGTWSKDKNGKPCFNFDTATRVETDEYGCTSLLSYLFGPKGAQKVINHFSSDPIIAFESFKYTEKTFKREMVSVKGIGPKKIEKAYVKYKTNLEVEELYQKFFKFSLSINQAIKIINHWGTRASEIMKRNVYDLLQLDGFRFDMIDRIALEHYHIDKEDKRRIKAILVQILKNDSKMTGNCYLFLEGKNGLIAKAQEQLKISSEVIRENVIELKKNKVLTTEIVGLESIVFLEEIYKAEYELAQVISSLLKANTIVKKNKIDNMIEDYEKLKGFKLAKKQKEAIKTSASMQFSIISGPPGSGKTTIVDAICSIFKQSKKNIRIKLCAPTGRAAKRMMDSTGLEASTIHRLLGYDSIGFKYDENNPLPDVDVLIVDEFSMTDLMMAHRLMMAIPINTVVIFVGDKDQLPSVDCGQVLNDLLKVNYIPKTILEEIYRQKKGSTTLQRALDFSQGKDVDLEDAKDFVFIEAKGEKDVKQEVMDAFFQEVDKYDVENVSLLIPQNVGPLGTIALNTIIRDTINQPNKDKKEMKLGRVRFLRQYDRVIQLKNYAEHDIYNGMIGTIIDMEDVTDPLKAKITVDFGEDIIYTYNREEMEDLSLAYATTIHKAQGSEMKSVIMIMDEHQCFMNRKKLVYTGWTRVKDCLTIIGQKDMVAYAQNNEEKERLTRLVARFSEFEPGY